MAIGADEWHLQNNNPALSKLKSEIRFLKCKTFKFEYAPLFFRYRERAG